LSGQTYSVTCPFLSVLKGVSFAWQRDKVIVPKTVKFPFTNLEVEVYSGLEKIY
jgi:hypothetical protein